MSLKKERTILEIPNTNYSLRILREKDIEEASKVVVDSFNVPTEPLTTFIKIDRSLYLKYVRLRLEVVVNQELSFIAFDRLNDEIVGVFIAYDYETKPHKGMEEIINGNDRFQISDCFLENMSCEFRRRCKFLNIKKILTMANGAVVKKARGNGILKYFFSEVLKTANDRGFEIIFGHFTNSFSSHVFRRMFKLTESWVDQYYDEFEYGEDKIRPYYGCNEFALKFLKDSCLYKEKFGDDICKKCSILVLDVKKQNEIFL